MILYSVCKASLTKHLQTYMYIWWIPSTCKYCRCSLSLITGKSYSSQRALRINAEINDKIIKLSDDNIIKWAFHLPFLAHTGKGRILIINSLKIINKFMIAHSINTHCESSEHQWHALEPVPGIHIQQLTAAPCFYSFNKAHSMHYDIIFYL